jgi:hypothetical protein
MEKKKDSSWKNMEDYRKGHARLKNAVLQHPEEDPKSSMYHYLKNNINRSLWVSQNLKPKEK